MEMSKTERVSMLKDAAELGALAVVVKMGKLKPYITQNAAYRTYGRNVVERWVKEGLIKLIKDGPKNASIRIDRVTIETAAKVSNRPSYQPLNKS